MALANFNRENSFIILMQERGRELERETTVTMKQLLLHSILFIIASIVIVLLLRKEEAVFFMVFSSIFVIGYNIKYFIDILSFAHNKDYDEIMYTDKYAKTYVNNEMLLTIIEDQNRAFGLLTGFREVLIMEAIIATIAILTIL